MLYSKTTHRKLGRIRTIRNLAENQQVIYCKNGSLFYSYGTLIGMYLNGEWYFTNFHDYSQTTAKYTKQWCGMSTKQRRGYLYCLPSHFLYLK